MKRESLIWILLGIWIGVFGWSIAAFVTTPVDGDGFTRGLNRLLAFLGWQVVAGALAVIAWLVGQGLERGSGMRRLSRLPILLAVVLGLAIIGVIAYVQISGR